jgi:hypothetical protein
MKKLLISSAFILACMAGNKVYGQSQATTGKQTNGGGKQCSSTGVGTGANDAAAAASAERNRQQAENAARANGNSSHSNNKGAGSAVCSDKPKK